MPAAILLTLLALALSAATSDQGTCMNDAEGAPKQKVSGTPGVSMLQITRLSARNFAAPAEEGKAAKETTKSEKEADGKNEEEKDDAKGGGVAGDAYDWSA